jgi:GDPmannose 4,6-dehydratase
MKKTAIITGILGQDGPYLAKLLLEKGYTVYGIMQRYSNPNLSNLEYLGIEKDITLITGDVSDDANISHIIKTIKPNEFYNLAAQSFVGASWELSKSTTEINAMGVLNILNAIKTNSPSTKFYQASTSEMYGNADVDILNEDTPFRPASPYAVSKLYAYWITRNYRESYSLFTSNGILFNHESPLRGKEFVTRKISNGIARIKLGLQDHIALGNIDSARDWGFAGDYVEAMWLMLQHDMPDDFVVGTGQRHTIKEFLQEGFAYVGIDDWEKHVKIDPRYVRPVDVKYLCADASKASNILGWQPKVSFKELVHMMIDSDLKALTK